MKQFIALVILACALCAVQGRQLKQQTLAQALQAAQGTRTSTLIAAVQAAGITIPPNASWTMFAPTNEAFSDDNVREKTGLTASQLLEPANRQALVQLLSYHVVPSAALRASQLRDGQQLTTLLKGAAPLKVDIDKDGEVEIEVPEGKGDGDSADVKVPNIVAGNSIIHVIDEVLIPASLRRRSAPATTGKRRLLDDDDDNDDDDNDKRRLLDDNDDGGDDDDDDNDKKRRLLRDDDGDDGDDDDKKRKT